MWTAIDVCDELEIRGFESDEMACNYKHRLTTTCMEYAEEYYDCDQCLNDADGDGVCDELEVAGCTIRTDFRSNSGMTSWRRKRRIKHLDW